MQQKYKQDGVKYVLYRKLAQSGYYRTMTYLRHTSVFSRRASHSQRKARSFVFTKRGLRS